MGMSKVTQSCSPTFSWEATKSMLGLAREIRGLDVSSLSARNMMMTLNLSGK